MARLYDQLIQALLLEMGSGAYHEGDRFFSYRKICQLFGISLPTARSAFDFLIRENLLQPQDRSGLYLQPGFRQKALFLYHKAEEIPPLAAPQRWSHRRFQLASPEPAEQRPFVAFFPLQSASSPMFFKKVPSFMGRHFASCAKGFLNMAAQTEARALIVFCRTRSYEGVEEVVRQCLRFNARGVAFFDRSYPEFFTLAARELLRKGIPLIRVFDDCRYLDVVSLNHNNIAIGYESVRYLARKGHRKMAVLYASYSATSATEDRIKGARLAAEESGGKVELVLEAVRHDPPSTLHAFVAKHRRINGFYVVNSWIFQRLETALKESRLRRETPPDIFVCTARGNVPPFKGVSDGFYLDYEALGAEAMKTFKAIAEGSPLSKNVLLEPSSIFTH